MGAQNHPLSSPHPDAPFMVHQPIHYVQIKNSSFTHDDRYDEEPYFSTISEWPIPLMKPGQARNQTHWCIIGRHASSKSSRRFFHHFPHAAENLLPCWSWWRRWNVEDRCGIVLLDLLRLVKDSWQYQLIHKVWKCQVRALKTTTPNRRDPLHDSSAIYYTPSLYWKNPRYGRINYVERPEDAWALRRLLISDEDIVKAKAGSSLHVGVIQRLHSRTILNLDDIVSLLREKLPEANISIVHHLPSSIYKQAEWFATKDIIIGAHGAAMMNCVWILPKTIVVQLYPEQYFFQSLEPLIETVGGIALDWYPGTDPVLEWRLAVKAKENNFVREQNITAPPNEVVEPILMVMGRMDTPSGWVNLLNVSTNWSKALLWMG
jgi:hypothetical protein